MSLDACLIVEQQSHPGPGMSDLLKELVSRHDLDGYSCRQLLLGPAEALLAKGDPVKLTKIKQTLTNYNIQAHLITPSPVSFPPILLSHIEASSNELKLHGREKTLVIPSRSRLLIVLAELSGNLVERNLSQILSSHRYSGNLESSGLPLETWQRTILQGRPVLDIYLLDAQGRPSGAVRAVPGKFAHQGLGDRATLSANQNLLKLIELTQEFAGEHRVDMRFGISPLPEATLTPAKENDLAGLKRNLQALTNYGWLQTDIDRQQEPASEEVDSVAMATATTGLLSALHPELAPSLASQQDLISELVTEFSRSGKTNETEPPASRQQQYLPPPPDIQRHKTLTDPKTIVGVGVFMLFGLLIKVGSDSHWLGPLIAKGFSTGAISGLVAAGFFSGGFRLLQLKRLIQNTPTSKIRSIAMGRVEIHGKARRQYAVISPMTNIACIYYRLVRYKRNAKDDWVVSSITSSGHVPFWVEDETGRVSVDPSAATVKAGNRQESTGEGTTAFGGFSSSDEKWVEEMIYDGALVYVLGEAQIRKSGRLPTQQRRAEALRRIKQDPLKRAAYDVNKDGQIDAEEWQAAREEVDEQLLREDLNNSPERKRQEDQVVISKARHSGLPFVIAETASEAHLTGRYTLAAGLLFTAAGIFSGVTLWLLLKVF